MSEQQLAKKAPYASFLKFVEMLNQFENSGIPDRVTHSNIGEFSKEVKSHLLQALKFLELIDEGGVPTDSLRQFFALEPTTRGELFQRIILASYKCPLEGLDLAIAPRADLLSSFNLCYSTAKETTRKCVRFFAYAALAAGFKLSGDLLQLADGNRDNGEAALVLKLFGQELPSSSASAATAKPTVNAGEKKDEGRLRASRAGVGGAGVRAAHTNRDGNAQPYETLIDLFEPDLMTEQELKAGVVMLKFARRRAEMNMSG